MVISVSGLVINTVYPYMGVSPDGKVQCVCCGRGVVEIKCHVEINISGVTGDKNFFLELAMANII